MNDSNSNWVYVCEKDDIDLEDLKRFDYEDKTFCIYKLKDGILDYSFCNSDPRFRISAVSVPVGGG